MRWTRLMVIEAINQARTEIRTFLHSPNQLPYGQFQFVKENLTAILWGFDEVERIMSATSRELPPRRGRLNLFPMLREFSYSRELRDHPSVCAAISVVLEGWDLVRDGPD